MDKPPQIYASGRQTPFVVIVGCHVLSNESSNIENCKTHKCGQLEDNIHIDQGQGNKSLSKKE